MTNDTFTRQSLKRAFRRLRLDAGDLTQWDVEQRAKLPVGRYWKLENGLVVATPEERVQLATALRCSPEDVPPVAPVAPTHEAVA